MLDKKVIPYLNLSHFYKQNHKEIAELSHHIFSSGRFMDGPYTSACEKELSKIYSFPHASMVGSCTDALFFSLLANNIQEGDEIIVTSFSFIGTLSPIIRAGAIPVFVDISTENGMMTISEITQKITSKTKAIIAVHLFGQILDMERINNIAEQNSLVVIEDAAQSIGIVPNYGKSKKSECICISFDPAKVVHAYGSAGAVLSSNESTDAKIKALRYHGKTSNNFTFLGYNSRINELQAALVLHQLKSLDSIIEQRKKIADQYVIELKNIPQIEILNSVENTNFHKFVIQTEKRDALQKHLSDYGIQTMIHYNKGLYEYEITKKGLQTTDFTNTDFIKKRILSLPLYIGLSTENINYITKTISLF